MTYAELHLKGLDRAGHGAAVAAPFGYDAMNCYTADPDEMDDGSGRTDKREVILRDDRLETIAFHVY